MDNYTCHCRDAQRGNLAHHRMFTWAAAHLGAADVEENVEDAAPQGGIPYRLQQTNGRYNHKMDEAVRALHVVCPGFGIGVQSSVEGQNIQT